LLLAYAPYVLRLHAIASVVIMNVLHKEKRYEAAYQKTEKSVREMSDHHEKYDPNRFGDTKF